MLDSYHALEHVSHRAKALFGEGTEATHDWTDEARTALLMRGCAGIDEHLQQTTIPEDAAAPCRALEGLRDYLGNHVSHLNYAPRLAQGRAIGSGQIAGACKNMIGRRLKQTGPAGASAASTA